MLRCYRTPTRWRDASNCRDVDRDAEAAFAAACEQAALPFDLDAAGQVALQVGDRWATISIHGATIVTLDRVGSLTDRATVDGSVSVLVADKVLGDAGRALDERGWSWLDRRGRLHLRAGGTVVDIDIEPAPRPRPARPPTDALASKGAQEVAASLLLDPDDPPGVRAIARSSSFAPSTISRALAELRDLGLVRTDGRPVDPDLFWALADRWAPHWIAVANRLDPTDPALALGAEPDGAGAAIGDTRAALAWGAPIVASADAALSLYVPDRAALDRIVERVGPVDRPRGDEDRVAIAPVAAVSARRVVRPGEPWPIVHPIIAALDLATDRARGHQILDEWNPADVRRVW